MAEPRDPRQVGAQQVIDLLTDDQVLHYFGTADRPDAVTALWEERRQVQARAALQSGDAGAHEWADAAPIVAATAPGLRGVYRVVDHLFRVLGLIWLGLGLVAVVLGSLMGMSPDMHSDREWHWSGVPAFLFSIASVAFVIDVPLFGLSLLLRSMWHRQIRGRLIDWAVGRPGQLGRGLPGLPDGIGRSPVARKRSWAVVWVFGPIGAFMVPVGVLVCLIALVTADWDFLLGMLGFLGVGLVLGGTAWLILRHLSATDNDDVYINGFLHWVGTPPKDSGAPRRARLL